MNESSLNAGAIISHYRVTGKLGAGGMGEVYLAEDTRLNRKVALKLLPAGLAADEEAKRRFTQEARAASALNHPHIITIYDIGSEDARDFIAMEYVEGESLRGLLSRERIEVKRAIELIAQAASGLAAAHEAGIFHRDIKPENLMVTRGTQLKILDFGLAKLSEKPTASIIASDLTTASAPAAAAPAETKPGTILGTVAYMSPEQAAARALDHRTDIFSLGVVLYEMLTGQRPFQGKSAVDVLHAIINQEPRPAIEVNPGLPLEAMEILSKAMTKEVSERYQHAGDFELDLRRLKRAIESNSLVSLKLREAQLAPPAITPRTWRTTLTWAAISALVILSVSVAAWMLGRRTALPSRAMALEQVTLTPLTTDPGYESEATFSPDGETIAYVSDRTGNFEIYLQQVSGGPYRNITENRADDVQPAFSPDGKHIAFVSTRSSSSDLLNFSPGSWQTGGDVWVMTTLGGNAKLIARSGNFPSWSPDGSTILYTSGPWFQQKLHKIAASGGDPQEIPIKFKSDRQIPDHLQYPRYSSDERWIVFEATSNNIYVVSAEGGEPIAIAKGRFPVWNAHSDAIIYSNAEPGKNYSLWQVPFSTTEGKISGRPEPLMVSRGWDWQASVSRDGKAIAFTALDVACNVEVLPFDAEAGRPTAEPQSITRGSNVIYFLNFSPDGRSVVFESHRGTSSHLWRADIGSGVVQLTSDPNFDDGNPRWSPEGGTIAFTRRPTKDPRAQSDLWQMTADGASPRLLTEKSGSFAWLPDGRALVYFSWADQQLYFFDLATKSKRQITDEPRVMQIFTISADGKWVIYQSTIRGSVDLHAVPVEGGPTRPVVAGSLPAYHPFVSPSGNWLYFQPNHGDLYRVPGPAQDWRLAAPEKVTNFPVESGVFREDPQISRDGLKVLYSRGRITGDIWIMKLGQ